MSRFIDFSDGKALMLNNADWLLDLNYVELLREVGACFSVNNMLRAECYKQRMDKGLSFLEFNYMIMQSYDFYHLYPGIRLQLCSLAVMTSGAICWAARELIRRKLGKDALCHDHHPAAQLRGQEDGQDRIRSGLAGSGKDLSLTIFISTGAMWMTRMSLKCMQMLTFLPLEQIDEMADLEGQPALIAPRRSWPLS